VRSVAGKLVSTLASSGNYDEATALLGEHLAEDTPMDAIASRILWCGAADLALVSADPTRALAIADRLVDSMPGSRKGPMPRLELLRGEALTALGRHAEAGRTLAVAHDAAVLGGARPLLWRILAARGRLEEAEGRKDDARGWFATARAIVTELAAAVPDDALRTRFLAHAEDAMRLGPPS
jgi:hypothetical protein